MKSASQLVARVWRKDQTTETAQWELVGFRMLSGRLKIGVIRTGHHHPLRNRPTLRSLQLCRQSHQHRPTRHSLRLRRQSPRCHRVPSVCNGMSRRPCGSIPATSYKATFTMERGGTYEVELFSDKAPKTVNNFVFLAREGYYDGSIFHRVIPGFMAQGSPGDPTGTGTGGPGYQFDNEFHTNLRHFGPGMLAMANAGIQYGSATNGGQFYITYSEQHRLDGTESRWDAETVPPGRHLLSRRVWKSHYRYGRGYQTFGSAIPRRCYLQRRRNREHRYH